MESFSLQILSPSKPLAEFKVRWLSVPSQSGYLRIGARHTDLVSLLMPGVVEIESGSLEKEILRYYIGPGLLDIDKTKATLFVDVIESPTEIDLKRAKEAEERALSRLKEASRLDIDIPRALQSLERARARMQLLQLK